MCLLELPIRDLLLAQRASRRFNGVINTSPRSREKLFFFYFCHFAASFLSSVQSEARSTAHARTGHAGNLVVSSTTKRSDQHVPTRKDSLDCAVVRYRRRRFGFIASFLQSSILGGLGREHATGTFRKRGLGNGFFRYHGRDVWSVGGSSCFIWTERRTRAL